MILIQVTQRQKHKYIGMYYAINVDIKNQQGKTGALVNDVRKTVLLYEGKQARFLPNFTYKVEL